MSILKPATSSWEYLADGTIVVGDEVIHVHPNMPSWVVSANMQRRVNRSPWGDRVFVLSLTDRCNIKCDFCCHPYQNSELAKLDCIRLVREACDLDFDEICVTGGEPYLRRDLIYELATICKDRGKLFGSITNGFWACDRRRAFTFAEEMITQGVTRVTFSWDPSHGAFVSAQTIKNGIDACMNAGMRVCLTGSFKDKDDIHANHGIDVSEYLRYSNFAVVTSYVSPAGWGKSLTDNYHAPVNDDEVRSFRCPGHDGEELVVYAQDGLVQPCCSVYAGYEMPELRIGDWRYQSVAELVDAQRTDGFFRIIAEGNFGLLYQVVKQRAPEVYAQLPDPSSAISSCHLCFMLMTGPVAKQLRGICDDHMTELLCAKVSANADAFATIMPDLFAEIIASD